MRLDSASPAFNHTRLHVVFLDASGHQAYKWLTFHIVPFVARARLSFKIERRQSTLPEDTAKGLRWHFEPDLLDLSILVPSRMSDGILERLEEMR